MAELLNKSDLIAPVQAPLVGTIESRRHMKPYIIKLKKTSHATLQHPYFYSKFGELHLTSIRVLLDGKLLNVNNKNSSYK